jgi:hypothetical protein
MAVTGLVPFPLGTHEEQVVKDFADVAQQLVITSACGLRSGGFAATLHGDDGKTIRVEFTARWFRGEDPHVTEALR